MAGVMGLGMLGAGVSGGFNAGEQQASIKKDVCNLAKQMAQYKASMSSEVSILNAEAAQVQSELDDMAVQMSQLKDDIRIKHDNFKKTYDIWVVVSILFLLALIFVFASKKLILKATSSRD